MLQKTRGIVLHTLKYTDSKNIMTVFTRAFGRVSYVVYRTNKKKSACRPAYLQPLSVLSINAENRLNRDLQHFKEIGIEKPFKEICFHYEKNSIAFFIAELLNKTIRQTGEDVLLYDFLENAVFSLDACARGLANFHLVFLIKLSKYLGFEPNADIENFHYFDLQNGVFVFEKPPHNNYLPEDMARLLFDLMQTDVEQTDKLCLNKEKRNRILDALIDYYRIHLPDFGKMQSVEVLHELFK
jgi:DNA repair protein RecO (recombination protein O)